MTKDPQPVRRSRDGIIAAYRERMPLAADAPIITLGEGNTPLVHAPVLSEQLSCDVYLKVEGANPTGSFKDRGMTMAVSVAAGEGAKAVVCASTGNTSASAAAYATRAGMTPIVLLPQGRIAQGKLAQAVVHGAKIIQIDGYFDLCLELARQLADEYPVSLVNSVNPARIAGQKSGAFEVVDVLGRAPDIHAIPVGNAGNISAYWAGYDEYARDGLASSRPRMWGFQAAGAAPMVLGHPVAEPDTVASAIRIGNPASADLARAALDDSNGRVAAVTDEQILAAQSFLAAREGVFCEPASAASVAGLLASHSEGLLDSGQTIVCTLTGNGLKDIDTALSGHTIVDDTVKPDVHVVAAAVGLTN
ncbi:threonine synthase [Propionibacteriaceae bacterium Y1700]|uniref:threonine synthase n=1 Tax=Microlunatus sp. Y1700 TaxID=3418487 RepID=UPI003DA6DCF9